MAPVQRHEHTHTHWMKGARANIRSRDSLWRRLTTIHKIHVPKIRFIRLAIMIVFAFVHCAWGIPLSFSVEGVSVYVWVCRLPISESNCKCISAAVTSLYYLLWLCECIITRMDTKIFLTLAIRLCICRRCVHALWCEISFVLSFCVFVSYQTHTHPNDIISCTRGCLFHQNVGEQAIHQYGWMRSGCVLCVVTPWNKFRKNIRTASNCVKRRRNVAFTTFLFNFIIFGSTILRQSVAII